MISTEEWRPVPGYEGFYEVSSQGRIKRPEGTGGRYKTARILRPRPNVKTGYLQVILSRDGKKTCLHLHHLVCAAFHGERPPGMHSCHNDGIKENCAATNLRWDTKANNEADRLHHDTHNRGERHGMAKLSAEQVLKIKQKLALGRTQTDLGREYGVSNASISDIARGRRWGWLEDKAA